MTACDRDVVAALGLAIARRIGEPRYNLWFATNTKFASDDDVLTVGVPNHFFQEWLQDTFGEAQLEVVKPLNQPQEKQSVGLSKIAR